MTISTAATATVQGGYFTEIQLNYKKITVESIHHVVPILENLHIADSAVDNPSMQKLVDDMKAKGHPVTTYLVQWQGKTSEELKAQLDPMVAHYKAQALFLLERTKRRMIENEECTSRSNMLVAMHYMAPLKDRMVHYYTNHVLSKQFDGVKTLTGSRRQPSASSDSCESADSLHRLPQVDHVSPGSTSGHNSVDVFSDEDMSHRATNFERTLSLALGVPPPALHPALAEDDQLEELERAMTMELLRSRR